jgi:hypothetical protein
MLNVSGVYAFSDIKQLLFKKNSESKPVTTYSVTVFNGTASGSEFEAGTTVSITTATPPFGQQFKNWTANPSVIFANANSESTIFTMPAYAVVVMSNFEDAPTTDNLNITSSNSPKIWFLNGYLHVSDLNVGDVWSVHSILGALINRNIAKSDKEIISLQGFNAGVYILRIESAQDVKVLKFVKPINH